MTDEQSQDMDDVKIRLSKEEIPVDDETVYKSEEETPDVVSELRNLGRQFGFLPRPVHKLPCCGCRTLRGLSLYVLLPLSNRIEFGECIL